VIYQGDRGRDFCGGDDFFEIFFESACAERAVKRMTGQNAASLTQVPTSITQRATMSKHSLVSISGGGASTQTILSEALADGGDGKDGVITDSFLAF